LSKKLERAVSDLTGRAAEEDELRREAGARHDMREIEFG
jgi:hypothetical protein